MLKFLPQAGRLRRPVRVQSAHDLWSTREPDPLDYSQRDTDRRAGAHQRKNAWRGQTQFDHNPVWQKLFAWCLEYQPSRLKTLIFTFWPLKQFGSQLALPRFSNMITDGAVLPPCRQERIQNNQARKNQQRKPVIIPQVLANLIKSDLANFCLHKSLHPLTLGQIWLNLIWLTFVFISYCTL